MFKLLKINKKNGKHPSRHQTEGGFTLLELAIVLIISGVMLSFMATALLSYMKRAQVQKTQARIERVKEALERYVDVNGNYPCAAPRTLGPTDTNFGRAIASGPPGPRCNSAPNNGTSRNGGVRIGAVPVRDLNLPDEFIADAWGHKFTYAVTEDLATPGSYVADGGRIIIRDTAGNSVVFPANTAHYIVVGHGRSGDGSYPVTASNSPSVPCGGALDSENCDNDRVFLSTLVNSDRQNATFYDDYIEFQGQTVPVFGIPAGSVVAFNLPACPDGWSEFEDETQPISSPARFPARGRFVVGARPPQTLNRYGLAIGTLPPADIDFSFGQINGGDAEANIPPFVSLLYCEKD